MELAGVRYSKPVLTYKFVFVALLVTAVLFSATHSPASYNPGAVQSITAPV
jgi:hypothetical protein